ncbi:MAG: hypothetical protein PHX72_03150 [Candidatus Shapirobacteria bacterium]|nr:hypothetical protein [Candidatus Shapirobacteria bacterium]
MGLEIKQEEPDPITIGGACYQHDYNPNYHQQYGFEPIVSDAPTITIVGDSLPGYVDQPQEEHSIDWRIVLDKRTVSNSGAVLTRKEGYDVIGKRRLELRAIEIPQAGIGWNNENLDDDDTIELVFIRFFIDGRWRQGLEINSIKSAKNSRQINLLARVNLTNETSEGIELEDKNQKDDRVTSIARRLLIELAPSLLGKPVINVDSLI